MPQLRIVGSGVIYINPEPGYRCNFACHSHVIELSDVELLCLFQRGQALYSVDSVLIQARSTDAGRTWVEEAPVLDPNRNDRPFSYHAPYMTCVVNELLLVNAIRWDRSNPDKPLFNEVTGGMVPSDTIVMRSTDQGATWSEPQVIKINDGRILTPSGPVVVLRDGRWMLPFDQWHDFDDPGPYRPRTIALFSSDAGETWADPVTFGRESADGQGFWHGRIIRLRDDRLYTLFWSAHLKSGANLSLHGCFGTPDGWQWSNPELTGIPGQTNWCVDLGDGRLVAIYTVRETEKPGFFAVVSLDGGMTWDLDNCVLIWDATDRDKIGINSHDSYPRSHDTISFGAPTAIALQNGDVLFTFWCTDVSVTHIRYARVRFA